MKESEARKIAQAILTGGEKFRSNLFEVLGESQLVKQTLAELRPKLFGELNVVDVAARILDAADQTGTLIPGDFMNLIAFVNLDEVLPGDIEALTGVKVPELEVAVHQVAGWDPE